MHKYEVGKIVENFRHHQEMTQIDIADDGAIMLVFFNSPTQKEVDQFKTGNFEIRFIELSGIIMFTVKIGNLNWMDAPYSPHLSQNLTRFELPAEGQGLALTLILIDGLSGRIEHIRLFGLSESFTRKLFGTVMEEKVKKDFNIKRYNENINIIFSKYSTKDIVKMSNDYCKFTR